MVKKTVIIVEDETLTSEYLKELLESYGYNVSGVYPTGEESLADLDNSRPDLVLMDINLAGELSGIETASIIKEKAGIPIVYLTAVSNLSVIERADRTGHFGFLIKPVNPQDLNMTVSSAIARASM